MWPKLTFAAFLGSYDRITKPGIPKPKVLHTEPSPNSTNAGSAATPAPKTQVSQCNMSRDEFIKAASEPGQLPQAQMKRFLNCVVEPQEALDLLKKDAEQLDKKPGLAPLEEASLMTFLEASRYTIVLPNRQRIPFYFRPDFADFPGKLKAFFQKATQANPQQQIVYVEFDLNQIFNNQKLPDSWKTDLQKKILDQISENYRGTDTKKFSKLIFTDKKPEKPNGTKPSPFTTILLSDRDEAEILNAKPSRMRSILSIEMTRPSPSLIVPIQAKDYAYRAFRKKRDIPDNIPDGQMIDYLLKHGKVVPQGLPSALYMKNDAFEPEFGNPHLDEEVIVFADQLKKKQFVDKLFEAARQNLPQDQVNEAVKNRISKILAYLATHELAHSLGLMHWEEPHNFMRFDSSDFDPSHPQDEHFNVAQKAYLEAILGK